MSKRSYLSAVRTELRKLNNKIDRAIMLGRSYKNEAREHSKLRTLLLSHS